MDAFHPAQPEDIAILGDGISVRFHSNGDGYTTVTARDALRDCERTLKVQTWIAVVERNRTLIREWLLQALTNELNRRPF